MLGEEVFTSIGGRKSWKLFLEYLIEDWMSLATLTGYSLKAFGSLRK